MNAIHDISLVESKLAARIEKAGGVRALARDWGVSAAWISQVSRGQRRPGPAILDRLGIAKVVGYRLKAKAKGGQP